MGNSIFKKDFLRKIRRDYLENKYFSQPLTKVKCGDYYIEAPKNHILTGLNDAFYLRDLCVGITAKYIAEKYEKCSMIDIGANIGDTAALISTYAPSAKLILVEASDYFFKLLEKNTSQLPNEVALKKTLVWDGSEIEGGFTHWGGTASFVEGYTKKYKMQTTRLSDIADANTRFVKSDTDGYDFKILSNSIDWLASSSAAVLYENQIGSKNDLEQSDNLCDALFGKGYTNFIVWDDAGFLLLASGADSNSVNEVKDLNSYLYKTFQHNDTKTIANFDVLGLHKNDHDIFMKIHQWYKEN